VSVATIEIRPDWRRKNGRVPADAPKYLVIPADGRRTLTAKEIATAIDLCPRTVVRAMKAGTLPAILIRPYRATPSAIRKWLESGRSA
jgi:hypothetical protein